MQDQEHIGASTCSPHVTCLDCKGVLHTHGALTPIDVPADGPAEQQPSGMQNRAAGMMWPAKHMTQSHDDTHLHIATSLTLCVCRGLQTTSDATKAHACGQEQPCHDVWYSG